MVSALDPLTARPDGGSTLKDTSGGMESGAEPILERHGDVVAKVLGPAGAWKAGSRKVGIESEDRIEAVATRWAHHRDAGVNMVDWVLSSWPRRRFPDMERRAQPYGLT